MDWDNFWKSLTVYTAAFATIAAFLGWLIRETVKMWITQDIEDHKNRLAYETALKVEEFRNQLQVVAKEHEVRFNKLHEKRVEIIAELHALLYEADRRFFGLVNILSHPTLFERTDRDLEEEANKVRQACDVAADFFRKHQLYLDEKLAQTIELFIIEVDNLAGLYAISFRLNDSEAGRIEFIEYLKIKKPKFDKILETLKREFRVILGSEIKE